MNGERIHSFLLLSACLSDESQRSQNVSLSFSFSLVRSCFSQRGCCFGDNTRKAKKASEREREKESEGESAPQERQTERHRKTRKRFLGREDDIVSDDDDSDDEKISSSTPGKIS
jgi:hypothetical protein